MKEVSLSVSLREKTGKGAARQSRMAGNIPGVIYGPEVQPMSIEVSEKDLRRAVKEAGSSSAIYQLAVNGKSTPVIIRDLQRDPLTSKVTHVDFHAISMNKPLHITVSLNIVGIPNGVKADGGIMQIVVREIDIACLPKDIPDSVDIDVSALEVGDSIHVRDLEIPNAKILTEERRTVLVVNAPTVVILDTPAEGEEEGEEGVEGAEGAEGEGAAEGEAAAEGEKSE